MRIEEIIIKNLKELPEFEKAEALNYIEYLQAKAQKKEFNRLANFSLSSAMRGMEAKDMPYSVDDLKESFVSHR